MSLTAESLRAQLTNSEAELKQVESTLYRIDGMIQLLKHLIIEAEKPEESVSDAAETISEPAS